MKKYIIIITFLFLQISTIASQTLESISESYVQLFNKGFQTSSLGPIKEAILYIKKNENFFKEIPNGNFYYNSYLFSSNNIMNKIFILYIKD